MTKDCINDLCIKPATYKDGYMLKQDVTNMLNRIIDDCDKCITKEDVKSNIQMEKHWARL